MHTFSLTFDLSGYTMNAPLKRVLKETSGMNKRACVQANKNLLFIILYGVRRNWKIM